MNKSDLDEEITNLEDAASLLDQVGSGWFLGTSTQNWVRCTPTGTRALRRRIEELERMARRGITPEDQ